MHIYKIKSYIKFQGREISRPFLNLDATQMIPFVAHKETINLAMQNGINLVALLLCDNDLIKRAVSARIKFYRKRYKIIHKILCRFKILRYERI